MPHVLDLLMCHVSLVVSIADPAIKLLLHQVARRKILSLTLSCITPNMKDHQRGAALLERLVTLFLLVVCREWRTRSPLQVQYGRRAKVSFLQTCVA